MPLTTYQPVREVRHMAASDHTSRDSFWSRVRVGDKSECWEWARSVNKYGYGDIQHWTGHRCAHRVAAHLAFGGLGRGVVVRHKCDNPRCCNPAHLIIGTHADNVADRVARDRSAKGSANGRAILVEQQVREILGSDLSHRALADSYGVSAETIRAIRRRRIWKHIAA